MLLFSPFLYFLSLNVELIFAIEELALPQGARLVYFCFRGLVLFRSVGLEAGQHHRLLCLLLILWLFQGAVVVEAIFKD